MKTMMNRFNTALFNAGKVIPRMWEVIDQEMDLKDCVLYAYEPDNVEDPYFADGLLWRLTYFLFNKHKKRVCYLYLRAISNSSHMSQSQTMSAWKDSGDGDEDEDEDLWASENDSLWSDNYDAYDFVENMDLWKHVLVFHLYCDKQECYFSRHYSVYVSSSGSSAIVIICHLCRLLWRLGIKWNIWGSSSSDWTLAFGGYDIFVSFILSWLPGVMELMEFNFGFNLFSSWWVN